METNINEILGSGIIKCGFCENEFHIKRKNNVFYYKHDNENCRLHLKTLDIENTNEIFKIFYYSYYKMFEINLFEVNKKIENYYQKLLKKRFELKNTEEEDNCYEQLFRHIKEKDYLEKEILRNEFYLSKKENINFEKMNNEEKNRCLSELIKDCLVFKNYIVIESCGILFIFNLRKKFLLKDIKEFNNPVIKNLDKLKSKHNFNKTLLRVGIIKPMILLYVEKIIIFK